MGYIAGELNEFVDYGILNGKKHEDVKFIPVYDPAENGGVGKSAIGLLCDSKRARFNFYKSSPKALFPTWIGRDEQFIAFVGVGTNSCTNALLHFKNPVLIQRQLDRIFHFNVHRKKLVEEWSQLKKNGTATWF